VYFATQEADWETAMSQTFLVQAQENQSIAGTEICYRTVNVDQCKVFYRETGLRGAPTVLLLHGFPTASLIFRDLIPLLADQFHLVAPDLPGFGQLDIPSRENFSVEPLSAEPPRLLLSISETSSSWKQQEKHFPRSTFFAQAIKRSPISLQDLVD
jgi:alpha/beta hydrolase fold